MLKKYLYFFLFIFISVFLFFNKAFSMNFFKDDYFFLKISRIHNLAGFINFFSPIRTYSYKPLASEVFYFLIRNHIWIGHLIVFLTYLFGLYFLFLIVQTISKKINFSFLVVFFYSISFIHVFQLYWLSTYQEIVVFAALTASFYLFLKKKYFFSYICYIIALFSKETAILFLPFFLTAIIFIKKRGLSKIKFPIFIFCLISLLFFLIYRYSLKFVTSLDNYKMVWDMGKIINNCLWYTLWGLGFPSFLPDYTKSIFFKFLPEFWLKFKNWQFNVYFFSLLSYLLLLFTTLIVYLFNFKDELRKILFFSFFCFFSFYLFLGPILFFPHRWMIRLTMPMVFMLLWQAYIIFLFIQKKSFKHWGVILIALYFVFNYFGVQIHQTSSSFLLESKISDRAKNYFAKNKNEIVKYQSLYFKDSDKPKDAWGESMKLENTFHGQFFLDYYFPDKNMTAIWGYKQKNIPKNSYVINSLELLR